MDAQESARLNQPSHPCDGFISPTKDHPLVVFEGQDLRSFKKKRRGNHQPQLPAPRARSLDSSFDGAATQTFFAVSETVFGSDAFSTS